MSALAVPLPPRPRLVSIEGGRASAQSVVSGASGLEATAGAGSPARSAGSRRPRLRVVDGGAPAAEVLVPAGPARRPVAPRHQRELTPRAGQERPVEARHSASPSGSGREASLEALAPMHPSVRAQLRQGVAASATREARVAAARSEADATVPAVVRRFLAGGAVVLAAVLVAAGGIVLSGFQSVPVNTTTATVQSGQSLWDVAVDTGAGDVNEVMAQIVELNGLTSSTLQPGQTLIVPAR
ncbi:hypothetical protein CWT12_03715 [Actinomyces sp. 432]|uniref:LysM peptidoglycan-binding domain-containing protein n=1 Tax=Actinomyces sp. 432 TaxID=2057798 RepID=UPI001373D9C9|nr:LysM peptidoglycan-binding domain-containing protein [Actinomyces sp. 432]QHO90622.1 hypothetical protein CWT12_03715 [Actinomyces sp. 432]